MMGFDPAADQKIPVPIRDWSAMKLALWRSKRGWEITARAALEILESCIHRDGCPGIDSETEPCLAGCLDRERRMSALVILNAARMFAPIDARQIASEPYVAPSRERYSEVVAELGAAQAERELLHQVLRDSGRDLPSPPPNEKPALPLPAPTRFSPEEFPLEGDLTFDENDGSQNEETLP